MISDIYEITRIPDLTLSKYSALDESGVDGVLKKHLIFLRQLHRVTLIQNGFLHWIYKYDPDSPKGKRLRIFLKIDSNSNSSFPTENKNHYKNIFITHSSLSPYFDITLTEEPYSKIDYEYMAVLIKKEKVIDKKERLYSVNKWNMNEDARLYNLLTMLQNVNQPCVYCVDVQPVDFTDRIDSSEMLGSLMETLRYKLNSRFDKGINKQSFQKDEYMLERCEELVKDIATNPHFLVNIRAYTNNWEYANMLLDSAGSEALNEGSYDIKIREGAFSMNDILSVSIERFCKEEISADKKINFWPTLFMLKELAPFVVFPTLYPGENIEIPKETVPTYNPSEGLLLGQDNNEYYVYIPLKDLSKHAFLAGVPGSGKTNSMLHIATELHRIGVPFLIFEPVKKEYRALLNLHEMSNVIVFSPSSNTKFPLHINPFEFPRGMSLSEHIRQLLSVFEGAFPLDPPMPFLLERAIEQVYRDKNWLPELNNKEKLGLEYPTIGELYEVLEKIIDKTDYESDIKGNLKSVLQVRIGSLLSREMGDVFDVSSSTLYPEEWLQHSVILELESMGNGPANFLTLMLATLIRETLKVSPSVNQKDKPRHVIFFEEAHNLIGPEAVEQTSENTNPKIAATFFIVKMLAEVRALNEAIIIADQLPTVMAPEVIKNTSLKIGHRITAIDDRSLLGGTMSADDVQLERMALFTQGQALAIHEGLLKPFELQVSKWSEDDSLYVSPSDDDLFYVLYERNKLFQKILKRSFEITISKLEKRWSLIDEKRKEIDLKTKFENILHLHKDIVSGYMEILLKIKAYQNQNPSLRVSITEWYTERFKIFKDYCNAMYSKGFNSDELDELFETFGKRLQLWD